MSDPIGKVIHDLRIAKGMTQEKLAEGICSTVTVSRIENGLQNPAGKTIDRLLGKLGTSMYKLCDVYYKSQKQVNFEERSKEAVIAIMTGNLSLAKELLNEMDDISDDVNRQFYMLLKCSVLIYESSDMEDILAQLREAFKLTQSNLAIDELGDNMLTPAEANIVSVYMVALYKSGRVMDAIYIGKRLLVLLEKHVGQVRECNVLLINVALNLSQCMEKIACYDDAYSYCTKAEDYSFKYSEMAILTEIEYVKAKLLFYMGDFSESKRIMNGVIPYMEIIGKNQLAEMARKFCKEKEIYDK